MKCAVYTDKPEGFQTTIEVAGCYCEWTDKILFLKRNPNKPQGNTWGVPGGKMDKGETPRMTVIREIHEEVGLNIGDDGLEMLGKIYCRLPHVDYLFYIFRKRFNAKPDLNLALDEHVEATWVTTTEALALPLISGGVEALEYYQQKCAHAGMTH